MMESALFSIIYFNKSPFIYNFRDEFLNSLNSYNNGFHLVDALDLRKLKIETVL